MEEGAGRALFLFLPLAKRFEGCEEVAEQADVNAKAHAHAGELERDVRKDGEGGEGENDCEACCEEAHDLPALLPDEGWPPASGDDGDAEDEDIEEEDGGTHGGRIELEARCVEQCAPEPFPRYPREENTRCPDESASCEEAFPEFHGGDLAEDVSHGELYGSR